MINFYVIKNTIVSVFSVLEIGNCQNLVDAINNVGSDSVNDLEQFVNSLLVATNVELNKQHKEDIQDSKIISIVSNKELPAKLEYIAEQLDSGSAKDLREWLLDQLRVIVGVPTRDARSGGGGDTGDAVYLRDGFQQLEIVARTKETFFKKAERNTLRLIIKLVQSKTKELEGLTVKDIDVRFSRNMTDGILSKSNAIAILHGTKVFDPTDVLSLVGVTTEPDDQVKQVKHWKDKINDMVKSIIIPGKSKIYC